MEHTTPRFFKHDPAPFARLLLSSLLSIALLVSDAHYQYLSGVRQAIAFVLYPLQRLAGAPTVVANHLSDFFFTRATLRSENTRLTRQHIQDAITLQKYRALELENAHLRGLLGMRERLTYPTVAAEIVYSMRDPFVRKVVIDKGSRQQIKAGQAVIDEMGLIGQVTRVYSRLSEVTLITDKQHMLSVQDSRNGLRAVLGGRGIDGQLEVKFIPLNVDFQVGDQLLTSGIDQVYPPGLPVAVVSSIERNPSDLFARIVCKPLAGVGNHVQVLVLDWQSAVPLPPAPPPPPPPSKVDADE